MSGRDRGVPARAGDKFDALADPGAPPPLNRLVAEFGLRSFETLRDWATWALDHIGENSAPPAGPMGG